MRGSLLTAAVVCLALLARAQQAAAPAPPTPAQLDQAIEDFARQMPAGITADRYAAFAVAMPADAAEYAALNKHALLVVAALSKDASELPLKRVYLEQDKRTLELVFVGLARSEVPADSPAGKLMGTHRVDAYYLLPTSAWRQPGTLLADFAAHRKEFILGRFPLPIKEKFIRDDQNPEPAAGSEAAISAVNALLARAVPTPVPGAGTRVRTSSGAAQKTLVHIVKPRYPEEAKAQLIQGTVVLHVLIGADGTMQEIHLVSGHPLLVSAAVEAVSQWRYRPFVYQGHPVPVDTQISVVFTLTTG